MNKRYLRCVKCHAQVDMKDALGCSGWRIAPTEICPACIERSMKARDQKAVRLDGRRIENQRQAQKRAQAKRSGRGAEFVIHGKIKSKRDPNLQKRIDMVVEKALSDQQSGHSTDVINNYHHLRFSASGLKVRRVG